MKRKLSDLIGYWRVETINRGDFGGRYPKVNVIFSNVILDNETNTFIENKKSRPLRFQFPPSGIRYFKIGSIWQKGELIYLPNIINKKFLINTQETQFTDKLNYIKIGPFNFNNLLPSSANITDKSRFYLRENRFAIIPVKNTNNPLFLLLPCIEILRFYYGVSDRFLNRILSGHLFENFIDFNKSILRKNNPIIFLKRRLSRLESFVAFRALIDETAKNSMNSTHKHFTFNSSIGISQKSAPKSRIVSDFPFQGATKLNIAGVPYTIKDTSTQTDVNFIYVQNLLRCYQNPAFSEPIIQHEFKSKDKGFLDNTPDIDPIRSDPTNIINTDEYDLNDEPSNANLPTVTTRNFSNRFSSMDTYKPKYESIKEVRRSDFKRIKPIKTPKKSIGESDYSQEASDTQGISGFDSDIENKLIERSLIKFINSLNILIKSVSNDFEVNTTALADSIVVSDHLISIFPNLKGLHWQKIRDEKRKHIRNRQIIIVEINNKNKFMYLMEMETNKKGLSTLLLAQDDWGKMDNIKLKTFVIAIMICNRWPTKLKTIKNKENRTRVENALENMQTKRIKHPPENNNNQKKYYENWATDLIKAIIDFKNGVNNS